MSGNSENIGIAYDLISEGEIELVNGLSSVYLNRTPVLNSSQQSNVASRELYTFFGTTPTSTSFKVVGSYDNTNSGILILGGGAQSTVSATSSTVTQSTISTSTSFFTQQMVNSNISAIANLKPKIRIPNGKLDGSEYIGVISSFISATQATIVPPLEKNVDGSVITFDHYSDTNTLETTDIIVTNYGFYSLELAQSTITLQDVGIASVNNISVTTPTDGIYEYLPGDYTTSGVGTNAAFSIRVVSGSATIIILNKGRDFLVGDTITISDDDLSSSDLTFDVATLTDPDIPNFANINGTGQFKVLIQNKYTNIVDQNNTNFKNVVVNFRNGSESQAAIETTSFTNASLGVNINQEIKQYQVDLASSPNNISYFDDAHLERFNQKYNQEKWGDYNLERPAGATGGPAVTINSSQVSPGDANEIDELSITISCPQGLYAANAEGKPRTHKAVFQVFFKYKNDNESWNTELILGPTNEELAAVIDSG